MDDPKSNDLSKDEREHVSVTEIMKNKRANVKLPEDSRRSLSKSERFQRALSKKEKPIKRSVASVGENKLNEIIHDLNDNTLEEEAFDKEKIQDDSKVKWVRKSRQFIIHIMELPTFHYTIIILIILDLIIVLIELIIGKPISIYYSFQRI